MDTELIEGIRVEQGKIVAQLVAQNPQWQRLQGMLDMAEGRVGISKNEGGEEEE